MIIALIGLPCAGKTTFSKELENEYSAMGYKVKIIKLSQLIKAFYDDPTLSGQELENKYIESLELFGKSFWANKILKLHEAVDFLIIDGVWYLNELSFLQSQLNNQFCGVGLYNRKEILYERACIDTMRKNEDINEFYRVMLIIKNFNINQFSKFISYTDTNSTVSIKNELLNVYKIHENRLQ